MKIAILGATSQIAQDLIISFSIFTNEHLSLFARRPEVVLTWLASNGLTNRYPVNTLTEFARQEFDVVINFVGAGNPARAIAMGPTILDVTLRFDDMVLAYIRQHPNCRYLFLSSGAVYGSDFMLPADENTKAVVAVNSLQENDWYGVAKLHSESRHRALPHLSIVDIRVFSYFSRTHDLSSQFFMSDIVRSIQRQLVLKTSPVKIVRDFLHPTDLFQLINVVLSYPASNIAIDCYTLAPIDKFTLLNLMKDHFGLIYEVIETSDVISTTGLKPNYYSLNRRAAQFGYVPQLNSMQGLLMECNALLNKSKGSDCLK